MKTTPEKYKQIQGWRALNKGKCQQYGRDYTSRHRMQIRARKVVKNAEIKAHVMNLYGAGKCLACGHAKLVTLTIDHVNDDGAQRRKTGEQYGNNLYRILIRSPIRKDLQVLCMNCQWRKRLWGQDPQKWPAMAELIDFLSQHLHFDNPLYSKQYHLRLKNRLMSMYGGRCSKCSCTDLSVLTIDHINRDGGIDRKLARGQTFYRQLLALPKRSDLRILCFNCQFETRSGAA